MKNCNNDKYNLKLIKQTNLVRIGLRFLQTRYNHKILLIALLNLSPVKRKIFIY